MTFGFATVLIDGSSHLAAMRDDRVYPLARLIEDGPATFESALVGWDHWTELINDRLDKPSSAAVAVKAADADFRPPSTSRPSVWCAGANYSDHVAEMGVPNVEKRSFHFLSPATVLNAHRQRVQRPARATQLDWEIELAAVIGRAGRRIPPEEALSYVAGYAVANDISVRDPDLIRHPFFGIDWTTAKNADGLTPLGPSVVPARFVQQPHNLGLTLWVNGELRQNSSTALMIVKLQEQIASLSALVTLQPGDLVLTGTPAGTAAAHDNAYLRDGDVITASIEGLGTLENTIGGCAVTRK